MADIKRILNKKSWTGRELGILEITTMALSYKDVLEGKESNPLVTSEQFRKMLNTITDRQQSRIYNGYISIHEWVTSWHSIAQTQLQQARYQHKVLESYLADATFAEDVYKYVERLPAIMTQSQYDDIKAEGIENDLTDDDGEELCYGVFSLIEIYVSYYLKKLKKEPKKANPLKAIRKKYLNQPVKSEIILSRYNEVVEAGYYTLWDGRRSDEMTEEEWHRAIYSPVVQKSLIEMDKTDGDGKELTSDVATVYLLQKKQVFFAGGAEIDAANDTLRDYFKDSFTEEEIEEADRGLTSPLEWHYYDNPPEDLNKWDIIEQELLIHFYPADIDGSGNDWSESNFMTSMEDFKAEFSELVEVALKEIDSKYFKGEPGLSGLSLSEWYTTAFGARELYEKDFFGMQAETEEDISIFRGNDRALLNGIAILRPSDVVDKSRCIDERGYFIEPSMKPAIEDRSLEAFFPECENYAFNVECVEDAIKYLVSSYYFLLGYNYSIDIVADYYDLKALSVFKMNAKAIETAIKSLNSLNRLLYRTIKDTEYSDEILKKRKLKVLDDVLTTIDYKSIKVPEENKRKAQELLEDFKAFSPEGKGEFYNLLCIMPADQDGEGAD